jgi:hypothetical protein
MTEIFINISKTELDKLMEYKEKKTKQNNKNALNYYYKNKDEEAYKLLKRENNIRWYYNKKNNNKIPVRPRGRPRKFIKNTDDTSSEDEPKIVL